MKIAVVAVATLASPALAIRGHQQQQQKERGLQFECPPQSSAVCVITNPDPCPASFEDCECDFCYFKDEDVCVWNTEECGDMPVTFGGGIADSGLPSTNSTSSSKKGSTKSSTMKSTTMKSTTMKSTKMKSSKMKGNKGYEYLAGLVADKECLTEDVFLSVEVCMTVKGYPLVAFYGDGGSTQVGCCTDVKTKYIEEYCVYGEMSPGDCVGRAPYGLALQTGMEETWCCHDPVMEEEY